MSCCKLSADSLAHTYCRSARCNRWSARILLVGVIILIVIMSSVGAGLVKSLSTKTNVIVGHVLTFAALATLALMLFNLAKSRFSASHHASVKAQSITTLEALLAKATDEAVKADLHARLANIAAPKSGCCK